MTDRRLFTSEEIQAFVSRPLFDAQVLRSKDAGYPRISVVVPSYNQGRFLERTLLSVLNQNYPNTELIVIDGGSEDNSVEVIRKYERYISYWASEADKGQSNAINKGFEIATGDLIGWQNSDDLYLPGYLHTVAESFKMAPKAQLYIGNVYTTDEDDRITWASHFPPFSVQHLIYLGWNLSSQAAFVTRDAVERAGPLREDIQVLFDFDWFIRVGKVARRSVLHRSFGGCYRIHPESKLSIYSKESRWPLKAEILRSHGIHVQEGLSDEQQWRWRRGYLKSKHYALAGLLYFPSTRTGEVARVPFPSISYPVVSWIRSPVLWGLSKVGRTRIR